MADVILDGVEVPDDDRLACSVRRVIDASRVALTAVLSGLARAVYD
jgi:hypothetical protein